MSPLPQTSQPPQPPFMAEDVLKQLVRRATSDSSLGSFKTVPITGSGFATAIGVGAMFLVIAAVGLIVMIVYYIKFWRRPEAAHLGPMADYVNDAHAEKSTAIDGSGSTVLPAVQVIAAPPAEDTAQYTRRASRSSRGSRATRTTSHGSHYTRPQTHTPLSVDSAPTSTPTLALMGTRSPASSSQALNAHAAGPSRLQKPRTWTDRARSMSPEQWRDSSASSVDQMVSPVPSREYV